MATAIELPLVVIVGPTASGKTRLAIDVALKHNGEIICADSRTIYKDMNIGTAKPTASEQALVPHWGIDLVAPGERFTAADFKKYADKKITEIRARGHLPILVGGTGLYVDSVVMNYQFGSDLDEKLRTELQHMTLDELHKYCSEHSIVLPENNKNKRYVIRSIERSTTVNVQSNDLIKNVIVVGIATDKVLLRERISARTEQLFEDGVVNEAKMLGEKYGWENEAMTSNIYRLAKQYVTGEATLETVKQKNIVLDWRLAKRQLTWLRRRSFITWMQREKASRYIDTELAKHTQS